MPEQNTPVACDTARGAVFPGRVGVLGRLGCCRHFLGPESLFLKGLAELLNATSSSRWARRGASISAYQAWVDAEVERLKRA